MNSLTFRFDIDTHKCIRDGVPNLLDLAQQEGVRFTFFLNTGKSISFGESVKSLLPSFSVTPPPKKTGK